MIRHVCILIPAELQVNLNQGSFVRSFVSFIFCSLVVILFRIVFIQQIQMLLKSFVRCTSVICCFVTNKFVLPSMRWCNLLTFSIPICHQHNKYCCCWISALRLTMIRAMLSHTNTQRHSLTACALNAAALIGSSIRLVSIKLILIASFYWPFYWHWARIKTYLAEMEFIRYAIKHMPHQLLENGMTSEQLNEHTHTHILLASYGRHI